MPKRGHRARRTPKFLSAQKAERDAKRAANWENIQRTAAEKRAKLAENRAKRAEEKARKEAEAAAKELERITGLTVDPHIEEIEEAAKLERELLESKRTDTLREYCRANGIPEDCDFHPRYGIPKVPPDTPLQFVENIAFAKNWPSELGGLGAFGHLQNFIKVTWPDIQWNDWLERMLRSLCDDDYLINEGGTKLRFVNWVGAGSCGKTFAAGLFACAWFMFDCIRNKKETNITLTSTSKGIIAQRVWPVIQKCFHEAKHQDGSKLTWGHLVDSKKMVQFERGDEKHSICALAVEPGDLQQSLDKIKGRHTARMMLIVDEANTTPQAIFECIPNMLTSVREIIVLVIGNAGSRLDPHGRCCEPSRGWKSIGIDDEQWETKGVEQWGIGKGICHHFDGEKSPNVLAGKTEHRHIYSFERWQQVLRMGDEYRNTLQHWSQDRGFWPPDGLQTTVFTEALVISHDGMGEFNWIDQPEPYGSLDPAFGGDDCLLQFGLVGMVKGPKRAIQLTESKLVPFEPESPDAIDYQIARYVQAECLKRNVKPEHFGCDATGIGRGVAALLNQLWSTRIHAVEFGGAASDLQASLEDPRAAHDVFANRWTELWYVCRDFLTSGQLRGLSAQAVKDFCSRTYEFKARRYALESKKDMKLRLGYSPDAGDDVAILVDVARRNGVVATGDYRGGTRVNHTISTMEDLAREVDGLIENAYGEAILVE